MASIPVHPVPTWWDKVRSAFLWATGACTFFTCSAVVLLATYIRPPRKIHRLMGFCAGLIPLAAGFRFRFEGTENIPRGRAAVWIGNHVNNFDPMALLRISPNYIIALEKAKHFKWPIYGPMVRRYGNLPVGAGNSDTTRQALETAVERLRAGDSLMVFPEGTRSRTGRLGRFRRGACLVAIRAAVPVLPFVIKGGYERYGAGFIVYPGVITIRFLPPLEVDGLKADQAEELNQRVRSLIASELGEA